MAILPTKKKKSVKSVAVKSVSKKVSTGAASRVDLHPIVTEKTIRVSGTSNTFAFRVRTTATKHEVIIAVLEKYGVKPASVRTLTASRKTRRRGRSVGTTSRWKKAYVTLPAGKTIDLTV